MDAFAEYRIMFNSGDYVMPCNNDAAVYEESSGFDGMTLRHIKESSVGIVVEGTVDRVAPNSPIYRVIFGDVYGWIYGFNLKLLKRCES